MKKPLHYDQYVATASTFALVLTIAVACLYTPFSEKPVPVAPPTPLVPELPVTMPPSTPLKWKDPLPKPLVIDKKELLKLQEKL